MKLVVEGWRFIPHSYAIVNQWQLLALLRRGDTELKVRDAPYCRPNWESVHGVFSASAEATLEAIPIASVDEPSDAILRIGFPYEFHKGKARRTAVFFVSEFKAIPASHFAGVPDFSALAGDPGFAAITPSHWSAGAANRFGFAPGQVRVVPHGVDPATFRPMPERRAAARAKWGLKGFVFLSVGAMTPNKGIDHLLRGFAAVAQKRGDARLVLKGLDGLHNSRQLVNERLAGLPAAQRQALIDRIYYIGDAFTMDEMADLYAAADVYVAPYRAEGFNLPVLEAAACGLPIICTAGGPTDDFVADAFCRKIHTQLETVHYEGIVGKQLLPDFDHFIQLMLGAMDDEAWRKSASEQGPTYIHARYNWDRVAEQLLAALQ